LGWQERVMRIDIIKVCYVYAWKCHNETHYAVQLIHAKKRGKSTDRILINWVRHWWQIKTGTKIFNQQHRPAEGTKEKDGAKDGTCVKLRVLRTKHRNCWCLLSGLTEKRKIELTIWQENIVETGRWTKCFSLELLINWTLRSLCAQNHRSKSVLGDAPAERQYSLLFWTVFINVYKSNNFER
jgi:hypothetical protein